MPPSIQKRKFALVAFLIAMTFCNIALAFRLMPLLRNGYQDFTIFYTGASLIRTGQANLLYDLRAQYQMQLRFAHVPIRHGPLPFNHPPFEAFFFLPFTMLEYWPAYVLWTALNLIMLAAAIAVLRNQFHQLRLVHPAILGLCATAFFPAVVGIIQGQDMILLLLLFVLAIVCLDRGKDALSGAFLGAGLFRPQLALPLLILLAARRWRVLLGFAPVALAAAGVSVAVGGWRGPFDYVRFVLHLEGTDARAYTPQAVPNLRGLVANLPGVSASRGLTAFLIVICSLVVFFVALRRIQNAGDSIIFGASLAAVTTILISFHALDYDLTLLLPTVLFFASQTFDRIQEKINATTILLLLLLLSPLYEFLWLVVNRSFLYSILLLWLYVRFVRSPAPAEMPA